MSELKEHLFVPYSELQEGDELTDAITIAKSYYLKSDADKVIAELKHDVENWIGSYEASRRVNARTESKLRHSNYKRCLAMAEICRHEWCVLYYERKKYRENPFLDHLKERKNRHREKWLELAKKFKEAEND